VSPRDKRLCEIERLIAEVERGGVAVRPDPFEMTDVACAEEWHRLCHLHPPGWSRPKLDPEEEAEIVAEWRRLTA
jgi:hypothetical protein